MSSDPTAPTIGTYAFEQLDTSAAMVGSPSDLLSSAWSEAEQIRAQARTQGEAEGRAAGLQAARAEVDTALEAMAAALAELERVREELMSELEHDAAELALRLSEQVLAGTIDVEPERVLDVARNALRRVTERRHIVLVVNPADLEVLSDSVATLKAELGGIEACDVQSDRRVGRGGVILRTDAGEIDARIESGLERARDVVAATLKGEQNES
jgi:flagellar assembly protein FliH